MRVMTTKKGRTVESPYTDEQAWEIAKGLESAFARDLIAKAARYRLSEDQWTWVHILAVESAKPASPETIRLPMEGITGLFANAAKKLQRPKVRLALDAQPVVISQAGGMSRYPGSLWVTDGEWDGKRFGRIEPSGEFVPGRDCSGDVIRLLEAFAADPAKVAAECGKLTGCCSFCGLALSDERSLEFGWGPVCATKWGMPYGNKRREVPVAMTEEETTWEREALEREALEREEAIVLPGCR